MRRLWLLLLVLAVVACGEEGSVDEPLEATEANEVELAGVRYRVVLFRQLNPSEPPDDALYEGDPPGGDEGAYAAFIRVCNASDQPRTPSRSIRLEDAFNQPFGPRAELVPDRFAYQPRRLEPGECLPAPNSAAEQTFDGAALVFRVPFRSVRERPLVLEISAGQGRRARIRLDL